MSRGVHTRRAPRPQTAERFDALLRQTIPDQADRILADPAWPALTTTLARAETAGTEVRRLLPEAAAERELDSAESPAQVLIWRVTAAPNRRQQAARRRSTASGTPSVPLAPQSAPRMAGERPQERARHR